MPPVCLIRRGVRVFCPFSSWAAGFVRVSCAHSFNNLDKFNCHSFVGSVVCKHSSPSRACLFPVCVAPFMRQKLMLPEFRLISFLVVLSVSRERLASSRRWFSPRGFWVSVFLFTFCTSAHDGCRVHSCMRREVRIREPWAQLSPQEERASSSVSTAACTEQVLSACLQ